MGVTVFLSLLFCAVFAKDNEPIRYLDNVGIATTDDLIEVRLPYQPVQYKLVPSQQIAEGSDSQSQVVHLETYHQGPIYKKHLLNESKTQVYTGENYNEKTDDQFEHLLESTNQPIWNLGKSDVHDEKDFLGDISTYDDHKSSSTSHYEGKGQIETIETQSFHKGVPAFDISGFKHHHDEGEHNGEVHYHEHKHMHKHGHKQQHIHKHKQEHKHQHGHKHQGHHSHSHGHKHENQHQHAHHHGHKHEHQAEHKHGHHHGHYHGHHEKHQHEQHHKHAHGHKHEHGHKHHNEHRHDHNHGHKHHHKHHGEHKHNHGHKHEHGHHHGHKHGHKHEHSVYGKHY